MNVNVIANPLKTFKVKHILERTLSSLKQRDFEFIVDLYPNYFDITTGVWNVAISQALICNVHRNSSNIASGFFHVSTSLLSHAVKDPNAESPEKVSSKNVILATIAVFKAKQFQMERDQFNPPIFFQVENKNRSSFSICYSQVTAIPENLAALKISVELTFLFQRIL